MREGDLDGTLEPRDGRGLLRDAGGEPVPDVTVSEVERLHVETDPVDDPRQRRRRGSATHGRLDRDGGTRVADGRDRAARTCESVAVAVEVQPEACACPDVDEHDLPAVGDRGTERRDDAGAAPDLVHLVAVARAELEQAVPLVQAEAP